MKQNELTIRKITVQDMNILYEMINGLALYEKRPNDMIGSIEMLKYWLFEKKIATAVIAEIKDQIIGYSIYYPIFSSFVTNVNVHIEDLFIKPEYRGQGYGKEFFYKLSEMIKKEGYLKLEWSCLNWNTSSIKFYEKIGAIQETGRFYFEYKLKND